MYALEGRRYTKEEISTRARIVAYLSQVKEISKISDTDFESKQVFPFKEVQFSFLQTMYGYFL